MATMKGKRAAIYKRRIGANIAELPDGSSSRVRIPIVWTSTLVNVRTVSSICSRWCGRPLGWRASRQRWLACRSSPPICPSCARCSSQGQQGQIEPDRQEVRHERVKGLSKSPFWSSQSMILTGTAAASGIARINSVGNLGGFFGPT
jgi:hypothetical protein